MAARMEDIAEAVADAADVYKVPLFGMKGTLHEKVYQRRGHTWSPNTTPISTTMPRVPSSSRANMTPRIRPTRQPGACEP